MTETLPKMNAQSGMALLVVLWIIGAGSLIVTVLSMTARSSGAIVGAEVQLSRINAGLEAGVEIAVARLIDTHEARRWIPDGKPRSISFAEMTLVIQVTDANALVDLNKSDEALLYNLYNQVVGSAGDADRFRDRVVQARDGSPDRASVDPRQRLKRLAERRDLVLRSIDAGSDSPALTPAPATALQVQTPAFVDASQVRHLVSADAYLRLRPFLTVYSKDGRINPSTAPSEVLASVPGFENGGTGFKQASAAQGVRSNTAASQGDGTRRRASNYLIDESGPAYMIRVSARRHDGRYPAGREFVVALGLDDVAPYRVLSSRPLRTTESSQ